MIFSELIPLLDSFDEVILILDLKILLMLASFETLDFFDLGVPEETSKVGDSKTVVSSKTGARFAGLMDFRMNLKPTTFFFSGFTTLTSLIKGHVRLFFSRKKSSLPSDFHVID